MNVITVMTAYKEKFEEIVETYNYLIKNENIKFISSRRMVHTMKKLDIFDWEWYESTIARACTRFLDEMTEKGRLQNIGRKKKRTYLILDRTGAEE